MLCLQFRKGLKKLWFALSLPTWSGKWSANILIILASHAFQRNSRVADLLIFQEHICSVVWYCAFGHATRLRYRHSYAVLILMRFVAYLSSYPGYFQEPHWKLMGLPEISRITWHVYCCGLVPVDFIHILHGSFTSAELWTALHVHFYIAALVVNYGISNTFVLEIP